LFSTMTTSFILGVCIVLAAAALTSHPNTSGELSTRHDTRYVVHQIPGETPWDFPSKAEPNQGPWTEFMSAGIRSLNPMHANRQDSYDPLAYEQWMNAEGKRC
jgi:hypothetical protein